MSLDTSKVGYSWRVLAIAIPAATLSRCASVARQPSDVAAASASGAEMIPTRYVMDRFFALPVTAAGDTMSLYLDTGGGTLVFTPTVGRYRLVRDSVPGGRGMRQLAAFPQFKPGLGVPEPIAASQQGRRFGILQSDSGIASLLAREASGQLGRAWFADRVWTLDYPKHRLLLHGVDPAPPAFTAPPARRVNLAFETDSLGRRTTHLAFLPIAIDGDSLKFFIDTGAEAWLTGEALRQVNDGGQSARGISIVRASIFARWRAKHPTWRVIEHADVNSGNAIIEVPSVEIAGQSVGPVWFLWYDFGPDRPVAPGTSFVDRPQDGGLGGSALKYFVVTIDYPRSAAWFTRGK